MTNARTALLRGISLAAALALAACSLPSGAALQSDIVDADRAAQGSGNAAEADFEVHAVTRSFVSDIAKWPRVDASNLRWIGHSHGSAARLLRAGDRVNLAIWDSSDNSLLTGTDQRLVALEGLQLSASGTVFLPYVGNLRLAGFTPEAARRRVQEAFDAIVPSAQVQLAMVEGRANSVDLVSGVAAPGSYPMPDNDYSVLSLIAAGGGVSPAFTNPQVRLHRGHDIYGTSLAALLADPRRDTRLQGGDQIFVEEDSRAFLSLGAAGTEARHPFPKDRVSALEALAIIGGVNDTRGSIQGVLILREYPASAVVSGPATTRGPGKEQVVFTLDLTSADGLFGARNFQIQSGDLVYATESPVTRASTIFGLIGSVFGLVNTSANIGN